MYVNAVEGAGDRIKPGCIDDDIELTADDLRDIDAAVSKIDVEGERYPPFLAAMVDR